MAGRWKVSSRFPLSRRPLDARISVCRRGRPDVTLVDLREGNEREKRGVIPGSLHTPYPDLAAHVRRGGMLHELASATGKRLIFYCAFGERSAMAVQAAQDAGLSSACHIQGGIDAWKKAFGLKERDAPRPGS
jgi:rhodanese-related sulfurtransferase